MPEQVEHLELDLAEFQERPPSQPLECVGGGGGGAVEPEEQEQPSIGAVARARWSGRHSRRADVARAELASEENVESDTDMGPGGLATPNRAGVCGRPPTNRPLLAVREDGGVYSPSLRSRAVRLPPTPCQRENLSCCKRLT